MSLHVAENPSDILILIFPHQGGLKAVVWTDSIQALIMLSGMVTVCIMGTIQAGGINTVFNTANDIGRFNFNKYFVSLNVMSKYMQRMSINCV